MLRVKYQVEQVFFKPFSPKAIVAAARDILQKEPASA